MRLLVVEDDPTLSTQLKTGLKSAGYAVDVFADGIDAEHEGMEVDYDLVVLDLGLPGKTGLDVLTHWRDKGRRFPVLVLTARDAWHERVDGFKAGADDYLGKPFHFEELLARIQALTRRAKEVAPRQLTVAGYTLNEERQALENQSSSVSLTGIEFRLLRYFLMHPGQVLSKTHLTEHVYENDADRDSNVIEVYVNHLRKKLGKDVIETRRGQGYVFNDSHMLTGPG